METEDELRAKLAMFSDGAASWVEEAEEQDFDAEAVEHVEEAQKHVREAIEILDG